MIIAIMVPKLTAEFTFILVFVGWGVQLKLAWFGLCRFRANHNASLQWLHFQNASDSDLIDYSSPCDWANDLALSSSFCSDRLQINGFMMTLKDPNFLSCMCINTSNKKNTIRNSARYVKTLIDKNNVPSAFHLASLHNKINEMTN